MKAELEFRIKGLKDGIEQCATRHNMLVGALNELMSLHAKIDGVATKAENVVEVTNDLVNTALNEQKNE